MPAYRVFQSPIELNSYTCQQLQNISVNNFINALVLRTQKTCKLFFRLRLDDMFFRVAWGQYRVAINWLDPE